MKTLLMTLVAATVLLAAGPVVAGTVVGSVLAGAGSGDLAIAGAEVGLDGVGGSLGGGVGGRVGSVEGVAGGLGSGDSVDGIPLPMLLIYESAATVCPGLSWTILAAIGTIESGNGQSTLAGVHSGHNSAGAEGPMQFEPATFRRYDLPVPPGGAAPPTPYDPVDAAYAAARMLCADRITTPGGLSGAIFAYNHSAAYVDAVLQVAGRLQSSVAAAAAASGPATAAPTGTSGAAAVAVQFALSQIGTPYRWGGETPGVAFDCSGLVQAAWEAAGVRLPRVAQQQFAAGPLLAPGTPLQPGDLVFFGPTSGDVTHVGMVTNPSGQMVDAPHTGAFVRIESFPGRVGAAWGGDIYLGATRPGAD